MKINVRSSRMIIVILFIIGTLFSIVSLKYFYIPYIWISIYWLISFGLLILVTRKAVLKSIWFNLAFVVFILGVLESYSYFSYNNTAGIARYKGEYFTSNEILGYTPTKGKATTSKKYIGQQLLYDVSYTINDSGLRISSTSEPLHNHQCVLFFGGSYTFGEGVEDYETMPYIVQKLSKYQVYNFGFHGYGPHQMLSAIQHGMVEDIINCQPRVVIYQATCGHVARSAGFSPWDKHGPKYILQSKNSISYVGPFDNGRINKIIRIVKQLLTKSFVYKKYFIKKASINENDVKLFIEIVDFSQNLLKEQYPGVEFHLIYWDNTDNKFNKMVIEGLKSKNVNLHFISQILPDYSINKSRYVISSYDAHPNYVAHQHIAQYVVDRIIAKK